MKIARIVRDARRRSLDPHVMKSGHLSIMLPNRGVERLSNVEYERLSSGLGTRSGTFYKSSMARMLTERLSQDRLDSL
jgi:hypothetical protein